MSDWINWNESLAPPDDEVIVQLRWRKKNGGRECIK